MKKLIIIGLILSLMLISGCIEEPKCWSFSEEIQYDNCIQMECYTECHNLNHKYFKYDSGGFASEECWCLKDGNQTIQIY